MKRLILLLLLFISFSASAQIVNIPDPNFKQFLVNYMYNNNYIDENHDGEIQLTETLDTDTIQLLDYSINDFTGQNAFTDLKFLYVFSDLPTILDLTGITQLRDLNVFGCHHLTTLILDGCINLESLVCGDDPLLVNADVSGKANLKKVRFYTSGIFNANFQGCTSLQRIDLQNSPMSNLDASNLPSLNELYFDGMNYWALDSVNVSNCPNLTTIDIGEATHVDYFNFEGSNNIATMHIPQLIGITSLDFSALTNLSSLNGDFQQSLTSLNFKNGRSTTIYPMFAQYCQMVQYICADDSEITYLSNLFGGNAYPPNIKSYCSFLPGGHYNTIQGNIKADLNNNGCDAADPGIQSLPVKIDDNFGNSFFTNTNSTGHYSFFTNSGNFTVTPVFSHPYFTISPVSENVLFDTLNSLIDTVDFCISPNGTHNDLEVTLVPVGNARPGFPVAYNLLYKNYGTTILSGNVQLNYDNSKMTFDNASPVPTAQTTGQLSWNFSNLAPFQSGVVNLAFTLLPPPANNAGDTLSFLAVINPVAGDEIAANNSFTLLQEVRNSFDPNEKECLEGGKLEIADIGNDLHYVIHFQNVGNDTAFNIVVTDTLSNNFDWNTVEFISSSHPCMVKQTNNKLEFYFQNIKLPWVAANEPASHGYVAFKVKPKSTVVIGDSINNKASIYFDFNFPVATNVATTIVSPTSQVPVKLEYFSVGKKNETNVLTWKAPSTYGTTSFNIERSADAIHFNNIGNITADVQRCQLPFNFTDDKPIAGKNYYRLKITDAEGISFYSKTLVIGNNKEDLEILAIANAPGNTIVYFNSAKQQIVLIKMLAADGKTIYSSSKMIVAGNSQLNLGLNSLPHGIYSLKVYSTEGSMIIKRFVK